MKILVGVGVGVCGIGIAHVNRRKSWPVLAKLGTTEGLSLTAKGQLWPKASRYWQLFVLYSFIFFNITTVIRGLVAAPGLYGSTVATATGESGSDVQRPSQTCYSVIQKSTFLLHSNKRMSIRGSCKEFCLPLTAADSHRQPKYQ